MTRTCSPTGEWEMVNTTQCQSQVITDVRDEVIIIIYVYIVVIVINLLYYSFEHSCTYIPLHGADLEDQ